MAEITPITSVEDADANFLFYMRLASTADASQRGFIRYNAEQASAGRAALEQQIKDMPQEERVRYARKLKAQVWKNVSDYGDLRMRASSQRVLRFWCDLAGVDQGGLE